MAGTSPGGGQVPEATALSCWPVRWWHGEPLSTGGGLGEGEGFLGRGSPAPALICMLTEQGISPFFSVSKQPNFLQGDLRPHPGWGDRSSCQMSPQCSAPCWHSGGKSPCLGLSRAVGSPGHGQNPPQHPRSTGLVQGKQAEPPLSPACPQGAPQAGAHGGAGSAGPGGSHQRGWAALGMLSTSQHQAPSAVVRSHPV